MYLLTGGISGWGNTVHQWLSDLTPSQGKHQNNPHSFSSWTSPPFKPQGYTQPLIPRECCIPQVWGQKERLGTMDQKRSASGRKSWVNKQCLTPPCGLTQPPLHSKRGPPSWNILRRDPCPYPQWVPFHVWDAHQGGDVKARESKNYCSSKRASLKSNKYKMFSILTKKSTWQSPFSSSTIRRHIG